MRAIRCMGILHREVASPCQVCLNSVWGWMRRDNNSKMTQSIFYSSVDDSASVPSLLHTYTASLHSQRQAKKDPDPSPPSPSLLTSLFYLTLSAALSGSVCLCYIVIYHIVSRVHRCHHISSPNHVKWVPPNSLWQKRRLNLWNLKGPGGIFFKQARLSGWQLAQLWPVTMSQCLAWG